ncbi:hypothetical protein SAMN05444920_104428 [Nonomuraea solani]|uniref:Uncharacterized protein n=1 Tax=Nonomuraea solani TaxID=1144553 RepID=A0A1H6CVA2_9ACTN|nr:hypothetical protein [Nonomuraea solani]SEG76894.1 hypothetical protein SAMN05444920_104428 [Nonomuraea solani]
MSKLASLGFGDAEFSPRLKLVNLIPSGVLIGIVALLLLSGAPAQAPKPKVLESKWDDYGLPGSLVLASAILILALMLQPLELATIRFLEGYGPARGPIGRIRALGIWLQARRATRAGWVVKNKDNLGPQSTLAAEEKGRLLAFPPSGDLLPTSLGNRLRCGEEQAGEPYGMDFVLLWPRLHLVLPKSVLETVNEYRNQLDTAARLCIAFALSGVVSAALLFRYVLWLPLPLALFLLSWMSYRAALAAAAVYATAYTAAVDVHRLKLMQEMRLELPRTLRKECELNETLSRMWHRDIDVDEVPDLRYTTTDKDYGLFIHLVRDRRNERRTRT